MAASYKGHVEAVKLLLEHKADTKLRHSIGRTAQDFAKEWQHDKVFALLEAHSTAAAKLDDLTLYAGQHKKVVALVARDRRLLRLELTLPAGVTTWRLVLRDAARAQAWLGVHA